MCCIPDQGHTPRSPFGHDHLLKTAFVNDGVRSDCA